MEYSRRLAVVLVTDGYGNGKRAGKSPGEVNVKAKYQLPVGLCLAYRVAGGASAFRVKPMSFTVSMAFLWMRPDTDILVALSVSVREARAAGEAREAGAETWKLTP